MFTAGRDRRTAGIVDDIYHHTIDVIGNASAFGRYVSLTAQDAFDVEYWPLELYKLSLALKDAVLLNEALMRAAPRETPMPRLPGATEFALPGSGSNQIMPFDRRRPVPGTTTVVAASSTGAV